MKKVLFSAILIFSLAQLNAQSEMRFGFQMSPSFSWLSAANTTVNSAGTNLGLKLGMIGEYYFQENYAVTSGLGFHFNAGGTQLREFGGTYWTKSDLPSVLDTMPANVKLKYSIQYVEVPVGLKMKTREFGFFSFFIHPQLTFGFKSQARGQVHNSETSLDPEDKYDIRKEVNGLNMSWGLDFGSEYGISESTNLVFGVGFQNGFTDVTDDNGKEFTASGVSDADEKTSAKNITVRLGIIF